MCIKLLQRAFVLAALVFGLNLSGGARATEPPGSNAAFLTQICSNQALPAGYVATRSAIDTTNCPGPGNYRLVIEPVRNNIAACFGSGYPAPYFITAITQNGASNCAGYQGVMVLNLPTFNMAVCVNSVFWDPWVITANAMTTNQCGGYGISTIAQASNGLAICSNSPIPAGWNAIGGAASSTCQPFLIQNLQRAALAKEAVAPAGRYVHSGDSAIFIHGDDAGD